MAIKELKQKVSKLSKSYIDQATSLGSCSNVVDGVYR